MLRDEVLKEGQEDREGVEEIALRRWMIWRGCWKRRDW